MSVTRVMRGCGRLTTPPTTLPPHDCITVVCCPVAGGLCSEVQRHCEDSVMSADHKGSFGVCAGDGPLGAGVWAAPVPHRWCRSIFPKPGHQGTLWHCGCPFHPRQAAFQCLLGKSQRQPWVPVHLRQASGENQTNFPKGKQNAGHQWQL